MSFIIYVAGPMTGVPEHNIPAFAWAERVLQDAGYLVLNPARHGTDQETWEDYMRRSLRDLLCCDGVALLSGWEDSRGATIEHNLAQELDMPCKPILDWAAEEATP